MTVVDSPWLQEVTHEVEISRYHRSLKGCAGINRDAAVRSVGGIWRHQINGKKPRRSVANGIQLAEDPARNAASLGARLTGHCRLQRTRPPVSTRTKPCPPDGQVTLAAGID